MPFGYEPEEERDPEPPDFVRMQQELADLDVGDQEGDGAPEPPGQAPPPPVPALTPATMAFTPTQPPPRDDTLQRLQGKAQDVSRRSNLGRVGDEIAAAFGGYKPDDSYWDNQEKQGKQPVADYLQGRGLERQGKLDAQNADLNLLRMKALLAKAQQKPGGVDKLAAKKALDDADAKSVQDVILTSFGSEKLKDLGYDEAKVRSLTKTGAKDLLDELQKSRGFQGLTERAKASLGLTKEGHEIRRQGLELHKEQFENTKAQNRVAGFEQDPDQPHVMQAGEAKELAEARSARDNIHRKVAEAKAILEKHHGIPLNPSSDDTAELKLTLGEMLPLLTTSSGMKSFTEGHSKVFTDAMGSPISLANFVNSGRLARQLETLGHSADVAVESTAASMGQHEVKAGRAPRSPGSSPMTPSVGSKKVQLVGPDGTPHEWDAGDPEIKQALANGWKKVP